MNFNSVILDSTLRIEVPEKFIAASKEVFKSSYSDIKLENGKYIVDFTDTNYIDSTALGALLLLKAFADKINASVELKFEEGSTIERMLNIVGFDHIFPT